MKATLPKIADLLLNEGKVVHFDIFKDSIRAMNDADMAMHEAMDCAAGFSKDVTITSIIREKGWFRKEKTATDTRQVISHAVIGEDAAPPPTLDTLSEGEQRFLQVPLRHWCF